MRTVLYVEDNVDTRTAVSEVLRHADMLVLEAETAAEGLAILETLRPDVLLLDMMLPDMSGLELRRLLMQNPHYADIPCIAFSAYPGFRDPAKALGMTFCEKPGQLNILVRLINEAVP